MKTKLHHYQIDITTAAGQKRYAELVKTIKANADGRGREMHALHDPKSDRTKGDGVTEEIEIETKHLFENQSNTTDGRRVFDWYEGIVYNAGKRSDRLRFGHWMEITPEIAELRRAVTSCGYCGKQYGTGHDAPPADGFCAACLDSPYLKEGELHLLRLIPVAREWTKNNRPELTDAERAEILPRYVDRQTTGADSRAARKLIEQRASIEKDYKETTAAATTKRDGLVWFLDHGMNTENVIYYSHTDRFCIGWRSPVSAAVCAKLLEVISEFPHRYTIKTEDGRTLENE